MTKAESSQRLNTCTRRQGLPILLCDSTVYCIYTQGTYTNLSLVYMVHLKFYTVVLKAVQINQRARLVKVDGLINIKQKNTSKLKISYLN